jgi:hypothetical protein
LHKELAEIAKAKNISKGQSEFFYIKDNSKVYKKRLPRAIRAFAT